MEFDKGFATPEGTFRYPHLLKPDTKFNEEVFKVDLILDPENDQHAKFIAAFQALDDEGYAAALVSEKKKKLNRRTVLKAELNEDGEETGRVFIHAKAQARGVNRKTGEAFTRTIPIFDVDLQATVPDSIWGGTVGSLNVKAKYTPSPVGWGTTLYLNGVQIIELRAGNTAESMGFGRHEDGFRGAPVSTDDANTSDEQPF